MREDVGGISLHQIGSEIEAHFEENPSHGFNCVCMDKYLSAMRTQLIHAMPESHTAWRAMNYVLVNSLERAFALTPPTL